ncbi:WxL protein host-binding domain-containing protein [Chryseobacterium sp. T20]|uniref:WxL protein host-binding domain-containing protein n=1 Tax=Chryseobacterium sp. T20 TaxID=3395375 RepID=UPI0039BC66B2
MIKRILLLITLILQFHFLHAGIVILNGLTHSYKIENGKVYKGKVAIENTGSNPQSVKIFLQDYTYHADGTINYTALRTNTRSNGEWLKLNTNLVTLKGKEKTEIFYEITVPNQAMDPGSYWSVIIVEPVEDIKPSDGKPGVSITSIIRYAIQVITDFETEKAKPDLKFESIKVEKQEGKQTAKIAIANNGNLYCKPTASIEIYNRKTGEKVGTYSSLTMGLLPNTSKTFYIDISKVPSDKYKAAIIATDEEENAFALNVELEVKNE